MASSEKTMANDPEESGVNSIPVEEDATVDFQGQSAVPKSAGKKPGTVPEFFLWSRFYVGWIVLYTTDWKSVVPIGAKAG